MLDCSTRRKRVVVGTRTIGFLSDDGVFRKAVRRSKHLLRQPPAWCISAEAFRNDILPNARELVIEDSESGKTYRVSTQSFAQHCFPTVRGGFEPQLGLALRYWRVESEGWRQLSFGFGEMR
jgi:hypothetical protein